MPGNNYASPAQRIGKFKGELLAHARPKEVMDIACSHHKMPKNKSDTVVYRRFLPFGASTGSASSINTLSGDPAAHQLAEGTNPTPDELKAQDITVVLKQYGCLYSYTDKNAVLGEDNIPMEQKTQTGERMGLVRELIKYGSSKGCTNKFYAGGTTRVTVDETITLSLLRKVSRSIKGNRGSHITKMLSASAQYGTSAIEPGFIVFCHTDVESDVRNLEGFVPVAEYGSQKPIHECEIGTCESFRFVASPELTEVVNAGALVGVTGLYSTGGSNIDVFPCIMCGADALGDVALRGMNAVDPSHVPYNVKSNADPLGMVGYVGAKFWSAGFVKNDGWMAVVEVGVTDL